MVSRRRTDDSADAGNGSWHAPFGHLIRIREEKDRARAIAALLPVREARVTFPGNIMGVTGEHIEALKREKIPFEYVSKTANGQ
jgi:hypothetical protein